jgi:hypothetical protein
LTTKRIIQFIALSILLAGLPLLSWYYLKQGFEYRKEVLDDLGEYARLTAAELPTGKDTLLNASSLRTHIVVWVLVPEEDSTRERMLYYLNEFHDQFQERPEVQYLLLPTAQDSAGLLKQLESLPLGQAAFLTAPGANAEPLAGREGLKLPLEKVDLDENPYMALTDSLVVKRYYDVRKQEDMKRLVEHIAVLLPVETSETELKREPEK